MRMIMVLMFHYFIIEAETVERLMHVNAVVVRRHKHVDLLI